MSFGENVSGLVASTSDPVLGKAEHWQRVQLGDLANIVNGYPWDSKYFGKSEGVPLLRIRDVTSGWTGTYYSGPLTEGYSVRNGDLVIGMDGDFNIRRWASVEALLNQRVCKIDIDAALYSDAFLEYVLPPYLKLINENTSSTTVKHLSSRTLAETPVPLPPLAEQHRIVAKLDALTARLARARADLERVLTLAKRLKQAALSHAFPAGSETNVAFGSLLEAVEAGKNLQCAERAPEPHELGIVKVSSVSSERFRSSEAKTLPSRYAAPLKDKIHEGDLLIARASGSVSLVGRVAIVNEKINNLYLSDKILRLRISPDLKVWVYWFLRSPNGRAQIEAAATGITMHNITQDSLRGLILPLPPESKRLEKLDRITSAFARADRLEAEAARARALLDRLEAAILAKAFRGELVPQDPADEPASVLLDRIRAERAATPKPKRGRRAQAPRAKP